MKETKKFLKNNEKKFNLRQYAAWVVKFNLSIWHFIPQCSEKKNDTNV